MYGKKLLNLIKHNVEEIAAFPQGIADKHDYIKVILTGLGLLLMWEIPWYHTLRKSMMNKWNFNAIATTDIVANPETYLKKDVATVLVSFARSGEFAESVATVDLAKALVWMTSIKWPLLCAADGKLALQSHGDDRNLLLLQPAASNDAGFAMTSSFTSMMLTALSFLILQNLLLKNVLKLWLALP